MKNVLNIMAVIFIIAFHNLAQSQDTSRNSNVKGDHKGPSKTAKKADAKPIIPVVDHHLHLYSPAAVDLSTPPLLPEIKLPEELAQFVRKRTQGWNDQNALAELYTEDALFFVGGTVGWVRGRSAVAGNVKWTISDTPYNIKPITFNADQSSARIAGYFVEADGSDRHFGFFLFSLIKASNGEWRSAAETYIYQGAPSFDTPYTAEMLIAKLDKAGIQRGVVMSNAYYFDAVRPEPVPDAYQKLKAENDWTAEQVAQFPNRLVAFCSFNPLKDYAIEELNRCAASGRFRGLKMNFNAAQLDFHNPDQVAKVRQVMEEANKHRLPMIIHVRSSPKYDSADAQVFLRQLVAAAPDVPIQIAHLWGGENFSGSALAVYAEAVASKDPLTKNLYFDISGAWHYGQPEEMQEIVKQIRKIGLERILYGSDGDPVESWEAFQKKVPLTKDEFSIIANNVAPYLGASRLRNIQPH
ncbi:amidohydrolase family protein [Pontibacter pamirensis]|uniref:amidohydrolase family protein n=1 Tax=Pontibacter pamirensis TaxID=2562824 RepID=UPI001389A534|nr:amidohydrolase family protein [Pontibacter pamirensis]